ncbi:MAG TPA: TIGR01457 family HAD-type hydrolase [Bacillota bacterium]|nr:TIGR01457 family HAD-type hydrolase [Bacillota bacterium]
MKRYHGYLIDLDGTIYRGNKVIEFATQFIDTIHAKGIPYLFVTNNSSKTPEVVAQQLQNMGIKATPEHVLTSSSATATYIRQEREYARCYVIGEEGLFHALEEEGIEITDENCDYVIMGLDRQITYEKLAKASTAIRNGAKLISTNADDAIPSEHGLLPGNGALTSVITRSTGVDPVFIGKPEPIMMHEALYILGTDKRDTIMVGDNYATDIQAGFNMGIDTLMVFTGVTSPKDLRTIDRPPTYHINHLAEWIHNI